MDTAEYTQQMLKISRDQLAVSRRSLSSCGVADNTFGTLARSQEYEAKSFSKKPKTQIAPPEIRLPKFKPYTDDNGFKVLNEAATQLEYRGRKFELLDDRFLYYGQSFATAEKIKIHLNQLRIPAT